MYFFWGNAPLEEIILTIFALVVMVIFVGAIYSFVIAIFQFIFSRGDEEKIKKAWNNIRYMIVGIILSMILLFILPFILSKLDVAHHEKYTATNIFQKATELIQHGFEGIKQLSNPGENNQYTPSDSSSQPQL